jgi:hypothetical protein
MNRHAVDVTKHLVVAFVRCFVILTLHYHDDMENPRSIEFMHANAILLWRVIPKPWSLFTKLMIETDLRFLRGFLFSGLCLAPSPYIGKQ